MSRGRSRRPLPIPQWIIQSDFVRARDGPERLARAYRRLLDDGPLTERAGAPDLREGIDEGGAPCAPPFMPASQPSARNVSRRSTARSTGCGLGRALPNMT